jgi:ZU5 domain-containing protein
MKQLKIWRSIVLAFTAMGFAGCSADSPTAPKFQSDPSAGLVTDLLGGLLKKNVLERKTALTRDITVSAVIGEKGGTLSIPAAGFTVTVPAGAVNAPTNFTVKALKGTLVAYEFGPHGIKFAKSLSAQQDLKVTKWGLLSLRPLVAGYFADKSALDLRNATALVSEVLNGVIAPLSQQFTFKIDHFSGYVVAW